MGKRILALDPGTKRIGVALSDEMGWIAQPLETIERRSLDADLGRIRGLVQEHDVERVLVGLPIRMDGTLGPESAAVQQFMESLGRTLSVPVEPWDERLTTRAAEDFLIAANVSRRKRKGAVDRVAAAILLESYLRARGSGETAAPANDHDPEGG